MKVYGGSLFAKGVQVRVVISADSRNQVAQRLGETHYTISKYWAETGNSNEIELAMKNPLNPVVVSCMSRNDSNFSLEELQEWIDKYNIPKTEKRQYLKRGDVMKTQAEIEALKRNWKSDPIWDIEDTEEFEEHKEELKQFRLDQIKKWEAQRYNSLLLRSEALGIQGNIKLANHIEILESRIKSLEERLYSLENITDAEKSRRRM